MRELGERLQRAREEAGISLDQLQNSTKIRLRYLQALEEGNFGVIPGEIYVRGFLQNYAAAVGIEPASILEHYDRLREPQQSVVESQPEPIAKPEREPVRRSWPLNWWQASLIGVAILASSAFFILRGMGENRAVAPPPVARQNESPAAAADGQEVSLVLNFIGRCWIHVVSDGRVVFDDIVEKGSVKTYAAKETIEVSFGNAGGVRAELNGIDQGVMGLIGQNLTRTFSRP